MPGYSNAFISYQTADRGVAASLREVLAKAGITGFLAHEDIEVSAEWRGRLLRELRRADVFVAVLSKAYLRSLWCIQESGIAAFKTDLLVVPLSLDETVSPAFLGGFQSLRIHPAKVSAATVAPAFTSRDPAKGLFNLFAFLAVAPNYRSAEELFALLMPHLDVMQSEHVVALLEAAAGNDQVSNAALCAKQFIPEILRRFPRGGARSARAELRAICKRYSVKR